MDNRTNTSTVITGTELAGKLGTSEAPVIVDVREPDEFASWAIPGAVNIPAGQVDSNLKRFSMGDVVVVCASGRRSTEVTDHLRDAGIHVRNLLGGMGAWADTYDRATLWIDNLEVVQVRRRGKGCLSYIIAANGEALVIDPTVATHEYLAIAQQHRWAIRHVADTHLHADHVSGARLLAEATGADLHLSAVEPYGYRFEPLSGDDVIRLGGVDGVAVRALAAPGHTEGSSVYVIEDRLLFSGDILFVDGIGRPDLADKASLFADHLFDTLHSVVLPMSDATVVLPAHYGDAVAVVPGELVSAHLGTLRAYEPFGYSKDVFIEWAASRASARPPNYEEIISANLGRRDLTVEQCHDLEMGPNRCAL